MKRTVLMLLVAAMLLSTVSCSENVDDETQNNAENASEATEMEEETKPDPLAFIPENIKFEGDIITIMQGHAYGDSYGNEVYYNFDDIEGGDIVAEAVYNRNVLVEEKLGVTIKDYMGSGWDTWITDLSTSITAGDNSYDMIAGAFPTSFKAVVQGLVYNLKEVEGLDPSNPWWDKQVTDVMTFGDGYYALSGDINFYDNYSTSCIFFNYDLLSENNLEIPYDAVREGTWTFDKLYSLVNGFFVDENGNGAGPEDTYGMVSNDGFISRGLWGMNKNLIINDGQGNLICNEGEDLFDALSMIFDKLMKDNGFYSSHGDGSYAQIFTEGRALFSEDNFAYLIKAREAVEYHIGILPYPKFDETQESYCCPINNAYCSAYTVAISADTSKIGYVLEAMGAASGDTVTEAVIEKNAMIKATRDPDSEDMIRIILDSSAYPIETVTNWGSLYNILLNIGSTGVNNYASSIARQKKAVSKIIAKDMDAILAQQ